MKSLAECEAYHSRPAANWKSVPSSKGVILPETSRSHGMIAEQATDATDMVLRPAWRNVALSGPAEIDCEMSWATGLSSGVTEI